ncbi:MAG: winged helix-turn-helix transcriptional regulator [Rhodospirillales bacterium]|nr:winged helix-turn-helix transcriptional regulator [Rhodospirillales bacterium]
MHIYEGMNIIDMQKNVGNVTGLLKALSHDRRLLILCQLVDGEKSVGEIAQILDMRDASASQQLALLRKDNLVETRRDGHTIYYSVTREDVRDLIEFLYQKFCDVK